MSRSTPCFVALCAATLLIAGCSHPAPDRVATGSGASPFTTTSTMVPGSSSSSTTATPSSASSTTTPASLTALADRLARSIPDDVVWCFDLEELRRKHKTTAEAEASVARHHPAGGEAAIRRLVLLVLGDARFGEVPWARGQIRDAAFNGERTGASITFVFDAPVTVPSFLGVPDEDEGSRTTTTDGDGIGQFRPVTPDEAAQFAAARQVEVSIDLRKPEILVVSPRSEPTLCRVGDYGDLHR